MAVLSSRPAIGALAALVVALAATPLAAQIGARPQAALTTPTDVAIRDVQVGLDAEAARATLVVRDGRIAERLASDATLPPGVVEIDGTGLLALPAFVDAFTTRGVATPTPVATRDAPHDARADVFVDMRAALRRGISPSFRAVDVATLEDAHLAEWRAAGFGYALQSPSGQFLSGQAALVALRDGALRERVLDAAVAVHASFSSSGSGYPNTLMGAFAHLRQLVLDAEYHAELARRRADGRPGPRPAHDPDLDAVAALASGDAPVLCEAESATDIRRWLRLAAEFGWRRVVLGGREAGDEAARLAAQRVPVVLTLDWGEEVPDPRPSERGTRGKRGAEKAADAPQAPEATEAPADRDPEGQAEEAPESARGGDGAGDDAEARSERKKYVEPFDVRLARRLEWERRQKSAIALAEAGVPFAFGSAGDGPKELLARVRKLVAAGLAEDAALAALTTRAAELYGEPRIGRLDVGADASLALWTADPFTDEKARVEWLIVEGHAWRAAPEKKTAERDAEKGDDR